MTDDVLPDGVNCSSQQNIIPPSTPTPETTTGNPYYVIPVLSAAIGSVLVLVTIVVLLLIAVRLRKSSAHAVRDEQLLSSPTEDLD